MVRKAHTTGSRLLRMLASHNASSDCARSPSCREGGGGRREDNSARHLCSTVKLYSITNNHSGGVSLCVCGLPCSMLCPHPSTSHWRETSDRHGGTWS